VVPDGLSRFHQPAPLFLTAARYDQAIQTGFMIPLDKTPPAPPPPGCKTGKLPLPTNGTMRRGLLVSQLVTLCQSGVAPVVSLGSSGCIALRAAVPSALMVCYLPSNMEQILEACPNKNLTPEAITLLKLSKQEGMFDEVIVGGYMFPPPHRTHISSSSYDTCFLLQVIVGGSDKNALLRLSKKVTQRQRKDFNSTSQTVRYCSGQREAAWDALNGEFCKSSRLHTPWTPGGSVPWEPFQHPS
jgi:hypothetical protein